MSFQAYLDNIQKKTGKSADEFVKLGIQKGFLDLNGKLKAETKAAAVVTWLKEEYELGHGHAMSIFAYFKGMRK